VSLSYTVTVALALWQQTSLDTMHFQFPNECVQCLILLSCRARGRMSGPAGRQKAKLGCDGYPVDVRTRGMYPVSPYGGHVQPWASDAMIQKFVGCSRPRSAAYFRFNGRFVDEPGSAVFLSLFFHRRWGDGGGGHWLVRMKYRPAGLSLCLPLLIFPCTIKKVQKFSSGTGLPR